MASVPLATRLINAGCGGTSCRDSYYGAVLLDGATMPHCEPRSTTTNALRVYLIGRRLDFDEHTCLADNHHQIVANLGRVITALEAIDSEGHKSCSTILTPSPRPPRDAHAKAGNGPNPRYAASMFDAPRQIRRHVRGRGRGRVPLPQAAQPRTHAPRRDRGTTH